MTNESERKIINRYVHDSKCLRIGYDPETGDEPDYDGMEIDYDTYENEEFRRTDCALDYDDSDSDVMDDSLQEESKTHESCEIDPVYLEMIRVLETKEHYAKIEIENRTKNSGTNTTVVTAPNSYEGMVQAGFIKEKKSQP